MAGFQENLIYKNRQWTKPTPDVELQSEEKQNQTSSLERFVYCILGVVVVRVGCTELRQKREAQQEEFGGFVGWLLLR